jgi:hypothetical protein
MLSRQPANRLHEDRYLILALAISILTIGAVIYL